MNILHYALGFPPYRTGGLTKYVIDLMEGQANKGFKVGMLWPGSMQIFKNKVSIKKTQYKGKIESYELINPLPVPLLNGIQDINAYTKETEKAAYQKFLQQLKPDIIHIHSLMGIHREFFIVAKELGIKIVFTSHDYFGICPRTNLLYQNQHCVDNNNGENCINCNVGAFSLRKIILLQSAVYRELKYSNAMTNFRNKYKARRANVNLSNENFGREIRGTQEEYQRLRTFYMSMFSMVDMFHFNSTNTRKIYESHMFVRNSKVIPITHNEIKNNHRKKIFTGKLKITYLGPLQVYKGFNLLKEVLDDLYESGLMEFELNVYNPTNDISPYMKINNSYQYEQLEEIFENTDVLIVPSLCKETFSFVTLEALSYGIPVILTQNVGAKDLLVSGETGYIIEPNSFELKEIIRKIYNNRELLSCINRNIMEMKVLSMDDHISVITSLYNNIE